ncbi:MAG: ABC transporter ATP-binding protein [Oscillospiraceae bacterium]|nr:ABC transporter ATP-binding protein [Oscillospiraceae bacterium]
MIKIANLSKVYKMHSGEVFALREVDLSVSRGEFLAIVGTSGSGKSTLMNILGCLDRPTSGSYSLSGRDVSKLPKSELSKIRNRKIGFIFQGFNLLEKMSALENVELPMMYAKIPPKERRRIALDALESVGLQARINHRPCELSGGQQQRVAIARAIVLNPSLILADEPTGNLDSNSGEEILSILKKLHSNGTTIVLITHDMGVAKKASRVIEISDGRIINT